jgi:proteasome lid subunit RPN8/RPN11
MEFEMLKVVPHECCGFLLGRGGVVEAVFPCRNLDESPVTFTVHPDDHLKACEVMVEKGLNLVGVYHSHPNGPAHPSDVDLKKATFVGNRDGHPRIFYVIVSLENWLPEIYAYAITDVGESLPEWSWSQRVYKEVEVVVK